MMTPAGPLEKRDQSLFFQHGHVGAVGKPIGAGREGGGPLGCADVWRQRHGVAACGQNHGTEWNSIAGDRRVDTHRRSFDNQRIGKRAHTMGPGLRKESPAACGVQGARQRQPCVADSKRSLLGGRIYLRSPKSGPYRCHGRVPYQPDSNHISNVQPLRRWSSGMMMMDAGGLWKWRGRGKRGKAKTAFPLLSIGPLEISQTPRDFHIPNSPTRLVRIETKKRDPKRTTADDNTQC